MYSLTGTHSLWPYPLSIPIVEDADAFYNELEGINGTYTPPIDEQGNGGWTGKNVIIALPLIFRTGSKLP